MIGSIQTARRKTITEYGCRKIATMHVALNAGIISRRTTNHMRVVSVVGFSLPKRERAPIQMKTVGGVYYAAQRGSF